MTMGQYFLRHSVYASYSEVIRLLSLFFWDAVYMLVIETTSGFLSRVFWVTVYMLVTERITGFCLVFFWDTVYMC